MHDTSAFLYQPSCIENGSSRRRQRFTLTADQLFLEAYFGRFNCSLLLGPNQKCIFDPVNIYILQIICLLSLYIKLHDFILFLVCHLPHRVFFLFSLTVLKYVFLNVYIFLWKSLPFSHHEIACFFTC